MMNDFKTYDFESRTLYFTFHISRSSFAKRNFLSEPSVREAKYSFARKTVFHANVQRSETLA